VSGGSLPGPLRIALVDPSGYSRPYDHELARSLAARGHDVTLVTAAFVHGDAPAVEGYRVEELFYRRTNRIPVGGLLRPAAKAAAHVAGLAALRRVVRRDPPDVVHVQWAVLRSLDRRVLPRLGPPAVFTAHDPVPNVGGRVRRKAAAATARAFPRVICHSEWGRRALVERCGVDPARVRVIPHGVLSHLAEAPAVASPVDGAGPVAVLPGLLRPYKGADVLLAAWPRVAERVPGARLVLAGRPMMDTSGLPLDGPGVVHLPRHLSDAELAALLRRADAVVLPYRRIDNSGVLFAALAVGAALVLSDVGGFRELHDSHSIGELVPAGDAAALADALAAVLGDVSRRDALRAASARAAAGPFSWDAIAERTEAVYRELLE
jgi:glycosyltransferase involved in cell wall biosynthesis